MTTCRRAGLLAAVLVLATVAPARGQLFLASRPQPSFTLGPLFVSASVTPEPGPTAVHVLWSLVVPPGRSAADLEQDLYLLWPGAVRGDAGAGPPDPALARHVKARGFSVIDEGRLGLAARPLFQTQGDGRPVPVAGGAPFVTFVRAGGALGLSSPVTYVRIPWTPQMVNRTWIMDLRLSVPGFVTRRQASLVENLFWGDRYLVSLSFQDIRARALFSLYFENRDRVIRLADDPSQLLINFADADHLKIDSVAPPTATRRRHESRESTEVVSFFLAHTEGLTPQVVTVQFGYFSGLRSWAPVLIPTLFFVLGNLAGPIIRAVALRLSRALASRFQFGRHHAREQGVILERETLDRIRLGETTRDEVLALAGTEVEEREQLAAPGRRTLVYRGRRVGPVRRRIFPWLARVRYWEAEHHEVEVELDGNVVRDVQARVRRSRLAHPDGD
jgi:hypothetical protein